jgi:hypothetical protein
MDNISDLQESLRVFLQDYLFAGFTFNEWKGLLCDGRAGKKEAIAKKWDLFGDNFKPGLITADVIASQDAWEPCASFEYIWSLKGIKVKCTAVVVKNKISYVMIGDMIGVLKHFGEDYDLAKDFDKNIAMLYKLKHSS